ncbi:hypothetical protein RHIZ404_190249 [Rhizobium sp. EC-SD404]|nr:hypothetical protein RHIZ404_190249 [Rhizobium sp. EC-SD404]
MHPPRYRRPAYGRAGTAYVLPINGKVAPRGDNPPKPRDGYQNHSTSDHLLSFRCT